MLISLLRKKLINIRKILNIFEFFKTTLIVNLMICTISVLLGGFDYFFIMFLGFGFLGSLGFRELYRKNDYLFYANNGVSKWQLLLFSYLFTCFTAIIIGFIVFLLKRLF
jgi:hypothetical protein